MIASRKSFQFGDWDKRSSTYLPCHQLLVGQKVVDSSNAHPEGGRGFALAYKQFGNVVSVHTRRLACLRMGLQRAN